MQDSDQRVPIQRLKMSWRTTDNIEDSGVYLLRHLEVYMGVREVNGVVDYQLKTKVCFSI